MGRRPKPKTILLLDANAVCCVNEERVLDFEAEDDPQKSLMDELQCPVADDVLIAMRRSYSLTFPRNPLIEGVQAALIDIRKTGVEALKAMPQLLADLGLPSILPIMGDPALSKVSVFKFVFARRDAVNIMVKIDGKRQRLLDVVKHHDASELIATLRHVVTATFQEAHDEDQHTAILQEIRSRIGKVLLPFNKCLLEIEIEPIAHMGAQN